MAGDKVRPGLESLAASRRIESEQERQFIRAFKEPFLEGRDVSVALQAWFDGRLLHSQGQTAEADAKWQEALSSLSNLRMLEETKWEKLPDSEFTFLSELKLKTCQDAEIQVVSWKCGDLLEYGLLLTQKEKAGKKFPLILYTHGAAFGIPNSFCQWLIENCVRNGYAVIAPAMRGEDLFQRQLKINGKELVSEGEIENLDGEVDDCLSMLSAAWKLPFIKPDEFAVIGHSFGAGAGLLTAARGGKRAKAVISYDAWLVNPQRYCWDRMRRGANNWLSWEDFCCLPVAEQLDGLKKRSIVMHADMLEAPLLLFIGGTYEGSVFHLSHQDFIAELKRLGKDYQYEIMEGGGHNFVLYEESEPAKKALKMQMEFLKKHYPASKDAAETAVKP